MKNILKIILCVFVGILIGILVGRNLQRYQTDKIIYKDNETEYYNSQIAFYDNMIEDINTIEIYDNSQMTEQILTNRNGKIIVEKIVGEVTNYKLDGKILNCNVNNGNYINYERVDGAKEGDKILTYYIYNPFTNEQDDVLTRMDFIIDDNAI